MMYFKKIFFLISIVVTLASCVNNSDKNSTSSKDYPYATLSINPKIVYILPNKTQQVIAEGGTGYYTWKIAVAPNLGTIDSSTGFFSAGSTPGVAIVTVTDTAGAQAAGTVVILAPLAIDPSNGFVTTGAQIQITTTGGLPPYHYSMGGTSPGTIDATTGMLTAPSNPGVGLIQVQDSLGNNISTNISYFNPLTMIPSTGLFPSNKALILKRVGGQGTLSYQFIQGAGIASVDPTTNTIIPNTGSTGVVQLRITDSVGYTTSVTLNFFNPRSVSIGKRHACAINVDGNLYCWGGNEHGQTGDPLYGPFIGDDPSYEMGNNLLGITDYPNVTDIAVASHSTCIIYTPNTGANAGKQVQKCWGARDDSFYTGTLAYADQILAWSDQNIPWGDTSAKLYSANIYVSSSGDRSAISYMNTTWTTATGFWTALVNLGSTLANMISIGSENLWGDVTVPVTHLLGYPSPTNGLGMSYCWYSSNSTNGKMACTGSSGGGWGIAAIAAGTNASSGFASYVPFSATNGDGSYNAILSKMGMIIKTFDGKPAASMAYGLTTYGNMCYVMKITGALKTAPTNYSSIYGNQQRIVCMGSNLGNSSALSEGENGTVNLNTITPGATLSSNAGYFTSFTGAHPEFANVFASPNGAAGELPALDVVVSNSVGGNSKQTTVCGLFNDTAGSGGNVIQCWGGNNNGLLGIGINDQTKTLAVTPFLNYSGGYYYINTTTNPTFSAGTLANVQLPGGAPRDGGPNPVALYTNGVGTMCAKTYLASDGFYRLYCWGKNDYAQVGTGSVSSYYATPQEVSAISVYSQSGWVLNEVKGSSGRFCARMSNGSSSSILCWGENSYGVLGQDTLAGCSDTFCGPAFVSLGSNFSVKTFAVGEDHACAVSTTNVIKCWGARYFGQLGAYKAPIQGDEPTEVGANLNQVSLSQTSPIKSVFSGYLHNCVILGGDKDGQVYCFGANNMGQLGRHAQPLVDIGLHHRDVIDGYISLDSSILGTSKVVKMSGVYSTFALTDDGNLYSWGSNSGSTYAKYYSPIGSTSPVSWSNLLGQGNSSSLNAYPTKLDISSLVVKDVSVSAAFGCVVVASGAVHCWGDNSAGNREMGRVTNDSGTAFTSYPMMSLNGTSGATYSKVPLGNFKAVGVSTGALHACAVSDAGKVKCWGNNLRGQLGLNVSTTRPYPVPKSSNSEMGDNLLTVNLGSDINGNANYITQIVSGDYHNCALTQTGSVICWGDNSYGQLGIGTTNSVGIADGQMGVSLQPVYLPTGTTVLSLTAGGNSTCALLSSNDIICWGDNTVAQLGIGSKSPQGNTLFSVGAGFSAVSFPK